MFLILLLKVFVLSISMSLKKHDGGKNSKSRYLSTDIMSMKYIDGSICCQFSCQKHIQFQFEFYRHKINHLNRAASYLCVTSYAVSMIAYNEPNLIFRSFNTKIKFFKKNLCRKMSSVECLWCIFAFQIRFGKTYKIIRGII